MIKDYTVEIEKLKEMNEQQLELQEELIRELDENYSELIMMGKRLNEE